MMRKVSFSLLLNDNFKGGEFAICEDTQTQVNQLYIDLIMLNQEQLLCSIQVYGIKYIQLNQVLENH